MADVKKVLSLNQLSKYDALLKAKMLQDDAVILDSAKDYVDEKLKIATDEEIIDMLMEEDMIIGMADVDGSVLADENKNILTW